MSKVLTAYPTAESAVSHTGRWLIVAACLGNIFESFDLYIFGIMGSTIAKLYFPAASDTASLLIFLSTFGVTFFVRPLGAVYLGNLADKIGRARVMSLSLLLMTFGMLIVAITPTFATIGIAAPISVVIGRILQGFSAGGEFGSATALLAEHHPQRRGFITSWQAATQGFALMSAAATGALLTASLNPAQFDSWGWRMPFVFGALLGPVGLYLRRNTKEASEFIRHTNVQPVVELLKFQKSRVTTGIGLIVLATIMIWMSVFIPTYAIKQFHMNPAIAFLGAVVCGATFFVLSPLVGLISDHVGRTTPMFIGAIAAALLAYPVFAMMKASPTLGTLITTSAIFGTIIALYFGPTPALMSELFPASTRTSGLSISYSVGVTIFGGFAPLILTMLNVITANPLAPSYYVIFGAAISVLSLCSVWWHLKMR